MISTRVLMGSLAGTTLLLSGCGGDTAESSSPAELGEEQETDFGIVSVEEVNADVRTDVEMRDMIGSEQWAGALVETCVDEGEDPVEVSWLDWRVVDTEGGEYEMLNKGQGATLPKPTYPDFEDVQPGDCTKGWVPFDVAKGVDLASVIYEPDGGQRLEWSVSD